MESLRFTGFHGASASERAAIVETISKGESSAAGREAAFRAFQLIKRETTFAFYTSRAGLIEALDYRGNSYTVSFPACTHPEHHVV